ncbi:phytoene desaturase family protein [Micrococcus porci]|uniref:phytoene desaturase family protein n=1 Tax=Micrococcus porci TaxID=2856555 RepID=UPI003CFA9E95
MTPTTPDAPAARPAAAPSGARRVVVIGGGFAGLATAGLLAQDGHRVTLLEKNPVLGGRSGRWSAEGFTFDTGPSWYLMPEVIDRWFRLMGTSADEALDLRALSPAYRVYFQEHAADDAAAPGDGSTPGARAPLDVVSGREESLALAEELEPGAGGRLAAYLDSAERIYALAKRRFLYTDFRDLTELLRPDVLRALPALAPQLLGDLRGFVARRFEDGRLRRVLGYPAVFLGTSPGKAPAMYHLMSHLDLADGVQYPIGGFAALVDAMAELVRAAGVEIVTAAEVTAVDVVSDPRPRGRLPRLLDGAPRPWEPRAPAGGRRRSGHVRGVSWRDAEGGSHRLDADAVVAAADLHHVQTALLPGDQRVAERTWDRRDPGPSAVLVCVGVRGRLPELLHHTLLFTEDWDENFRRIDEGEDLPEETSLYASMTSATDPGVAPEGDESLFLLVPAPAVPEWGRGGVRTPDEDRAGDAQVEAVADRALAQLARWAGVPDLGERIVVRRTWGPADFAADVHAWRGSLLGPGHVLRQSALFRPPVRDPRVAGLVYAGSSVRPGIGVPMCLISAELARDAVSGVRPGGAAPGAPAMAGR